MNEKIVPVKMFGRRQIIICWLFIENLGHLCSTRGQEQKSRRRSRYTQTRQTFLSDSPCKKLDLLVFVPSAARPIRRLPHSKLPRQADKFCSNTKLPRRAGGQILQQHKANIQTLMSATFIIAVASSGTLQGSPPPRLKPPGYILRSKPRLSAIENEIDAAGGRGRNLDPNRCIGFASSCNHLPCFFIVFGHSETPADANICFCF